jgi:hypothetical protein
MPLQTPLSGPPYFDRFSTANKYYDVALRPSRSVQTGELNEVQSILRNQIEKFGDSIFQKGTIIKGCNFVFYDNYPYAKISDTAVDGTTVVAASFLSLFAQNDDGLKAYVTNTLEGFETADLQKTLYLTYVNSGSNNSTDEFSPGDTLTILSGNYPIFSVSIDNGAFNFGKSDQIVSVSAITVNVSSGAFTNGEYIINPTTGANVQIVGITPGLSTNTFILSLKPRNADLIDPTKNANNWTFSLNDNIKNVSNTTFATVNYIWGSGFQAEIDINSLGKVIDVTVTNTGSGYSVLPWVGVQSANNGSGVNALVLTPQNYLRKVKVLSQSNSVGSGYAFGVSNGVIYQRGLFLEVDEQIVVVDYYDNQPNNVAVGFDTVESIETYLTDPNLLDNSFTEKNKLAPGADRVKCNPVLVVVNTDAAQTNTEFFPLVEWNSGNPFRQIQDTQYSIIGDEMARRTSETNGDFVLDQFLCTTDAITNTQQDASYYVAVVDPGTAYIDGYRTTTVSNYRIQVPKGLDTKVANAQKVSISYGPYVRVKELGGVFQYSTGDTVNFYDTPKTFLSNASLATSGNVTPQGTLIGSARVRNMILESGLPGDTNAIYRLYLFNINMNAGIDFRSIRSIAYNGTFKGISDTVLSYDPTTNSQVAFLNGSDNDSLVFPTGLESIKNSNNTTYTYRTIDQSTSFSNSGILTKSIATSPNEFYPYSGSLTSSQLDDLYVVPLSNNLIQYTPLTGNVSVNTTSPIVVGTGTTALNDIQAGDYVYIYANSSIGNIKKVVSVANATSFTVDSNLTFSNTSCLYKRAFPKLVPIPFGIRSGLTANVNSNGTILTLNLGFTIDSTTSVNTAIGVNIQRTGVSSTSKTVNRHQFVKLALANNAGGVAGPWCLGVSDAFRLRNVYIDNSSVSNTSPNVVNEFYLETNQTPDYNDLSYLYLDPKSSLALNSGEYLLVEFDYYSTSGAGYYDTVSYLHTANASQIAVLDSTPLANLTSAACSWEIPEIHADDGSYYDLINCIDFRPAVVNTVATSTNPASAPLNPAYVLSFGNTADPTTDRKFPLPGSLFQSDIEIYMGRIDDVIIGHDGNITVLQGTPNQDPTRRNEPNLPDGCLKLQSISVPAYPNISKNINQQIANLVSTGAVNEVNIQTRVTNHTVSPLLNANNVALAQPKAYSMSDIGNLERRISDLEYEVTLTALEAGVTKRVIPSSVDGTLNRFKYGFFVDDFSTFQYTDTTNPQYSATIETVDGDLRVTNSTLPQVASNLLVPSKFIWPLKHVIQQPKPNSDNFTIVNQNTATEFFPPCTINTVSTTVNSFNIATLYNVFDYQIDPNTQLLATGARANRACQMASVAGPVTLYYYFGFDPQIVVYQNGVAVHSTAEAVPMTAADVAYLNSTPDTAQFWAPIQRLFSSNVLTLFQKFSDGFVLYGGKLSFTHNPAGGTNYNIVTNTPFTGPGGEDQHVGVFQWMMQYPINSSVASTRTVEVCQGTQPTIYNGVMHANSVLNTMNSVTGGTNGNDILVITCTGLRPNTKHTFVADSVTQSVNVRPNGGNWGDDLVTDNQGRITINYVLPQSYYNALKKQQTPTIKATSTYIYTPKVGQVAGWQAAKQGDFIQTDKIYSGLILNDSQTLLEIKATNSYAGAYVPIVVPNKISF